jgi:hypothetical protein
MTLDTSKGRGLRPLAAGPGTGGGLVGEPAKDGVFGTCY